METAIIAASGILLVSAAMPHVKFAHGAVRMFDFPRQQLLVIAVGIFVASFFIGGSGWLYHAAQAALLVPIAVDGWFVMHFTPFWRQETSEASERELATGAAFRLVTANVKQANKDFGRLIALLIEHDPDIVILMEISHDWEFALGKTLEAFPHRVTRAQDNTYGMIVASKFPLDDMQVRCLLTDGVPSITATVMPPDGRPFRLYAIHPEPPVPNSTTAGRDGETAQVAFEVRDETRPVIVAGDLNDVAWSHTTRRFRRISGLLDPRIGRGFYNTFDARYPILRWPLDHLFHSADFRLIEIRRLPAFGSDHFAMRFDLLLCADPDCGDTPPQPNGDDIREAKEDIRAAAEREEKPIGTDWEN